MKSETFTLAIVLLILTGHSFAQLPTMTAHVVQPETFTFNIESDSTGICADSVYGSSFLTVLNCDSILFAPDTSFVGNDTGYYMACDSNLSCDTGMIIVTVSPDYTLWPVADFTAGVPSSCSTETWTPAYSYFELHNSSINDDSVYWYPEVFGRDCIVYGEHLALIPWEFVNDCFHFELSPDISFCIVAINQFGIDTFCNTVCSNLWWHSINELQPPPMQVYPNPTQGNVKINVPADEIGNYIELTDLIGRKIARINLETTQVVFKTDDFSQGCYLLSLKNPKVPYKALKLVMEK